MRIQQLTNPVTDSSKGHKTKEPYHIYLRTYHTWPAPPYTIYLINRSASQVITQLYSKHSGSLDPITENSHSESSASTTTTTIAITYYLLPATYHYYPPNYPAHYLLPTNYPPLLRYYSHSESSASTTTTTIAITYYLLPATYHYYPPNYLAHYLLPTNYQLLFLELPLL